MAYDSESGDAAFVDAGLVALPPQVAAAGAGVKMLNLSENTLQSWEGFEALTELKTLILDKNGLDSVTGAPVLPSVTELWFNNNAVHNLTDFLDGVVASFPSLTRLSLMRNPAAPPLVALSQEDISKAARYRLYTIYRIPALSFLDASPVTAAERSEAAAKGQFYAVKKSAVAASRRGSALGGGGVSQAGSTLDGGLSSSGGHAHAAGEVGSGGGPAEGTPAAAATGGETRSRPPAAYLAFSRTTYDGKHSEGNRFITGDQL